MEQYSIFLQTIRTQNEANQVTINDNNINNNNN